MWSSRRIIVLFLFSLGYIPLTSPAAPGNAASLRPGVASTAGGDQHRGGTVVYRKGELSKGTIDREWPHQVALRADLVAGRNFTIIHEFCRLLSLCPRGHSFRRDGADFIVFCFADCSHAERFRDRFGGEIIDPSSGPHKAGFG
jgi:hypothetical protein